MRARVGQRYEVVVNGVLRLGSVRTVAEDRVELDLAEEIQSEAVVPVTLVVAMFKFDRFEWAVEKATELGVTRIVPAIARRTDAHLVQAAKKRVERWRRIAHEAAQQSRRVAAPEIDEPVKLKAAMSIDARLKILLAETEQDRSLKDALRESRSEATRVHNPAIENDSLALAVGPEGGWTEDEIQLFMTNGWIPATLGPTILRAETAVIAGLAVVAALSK